MLDFGLKPNLVKRTLYFVHLVPVAIPTFFHISAKVLGSRLKLVVPALIAGTSVGFTLPLCFRQ